MQTIIHTPTPNLRDSIDFYKKLNYTLLSKGDPTLITDGQALIEINPDRFARAGLKLMKASWAEEVRVLKQLTRLYTTDNGFLLNDFNGCWIYLEEGDMDLSEENDRIAEALPGNFQGLSLESADMSKSLDIWEVLGFTIAQGKPDQGFVVLSNEEGFQVSLMQPLTCPHLFFNPSMTFFNGENNPKIIENIRKAGIPITVEITVFNEEGEVDNIIIRDPGGYGFFIFND